MKRIWSNIGKQPGGTIREYELERPDGAMLIMKVFKTLKDEVSLDDGSGEEWTYYKNAKEAEKVALKWFNSGDRWYPGYDG